MSELPRAVAIIIEDCFDVRPGEDALVIADEGTRMIGEALRGAAAERGSDAVLAIKDERGTDGTEPPAPIAPALAPSGSTGNVSPGRPRPGAVRRGRRIRRVAALREDPRTKPGGHPARHNGWNVSRSPTSDLYIAATTRSLSHTTTRKQATDAGIRGATMPGVTPEMLARAMAVDFEKMAARSNAIAKLLTAGTTARVSCPLGTEATFDLTGRSGIPDDGNLTDPGAFGNLPCGEGFIAPLNGEGRIVTSSFAHPGVSHEPAVLNLRDGRLVSAERGTGPEYLRLLEAHGPLGMNLAELGVGTNERTGDAHGQCPRGREDPGTVHVAFRGERRDRGHHLGADPSRRRRDRGQPDHRRSCGPRGGTARAECIG